MIETKHNQQLPQAGLKNVRRLAWLALLWERFWPLALPLLCIIALFVTVSWLGLWPLMLAPLHLALLGVFALGSLFGLLPLRNLRLPSLKEVDNRIERNSGLTHRPVTAQVDRRSKVTDSNDPFAKALWQEHQKRMAGTLGNLKPGLPMPNVAARDPFGLRALIGLFLFIGFAAGWGNWSSRIQDAFTVHTGLNATQGRIDAWVTPPSYTNRPPIFLSRSSKANEGKSPLITVPEGSELVVRIAGLENPSLSLLNGEQEVGVSPQISAESKDGKTKLASTTFKIKLQNSTIALLRSGDSGAGQWSFEIKPDENPSIAFVDSPKSSNRGALEFSYKITDDYGVASARAEIASFLKTDKETRPLIKAPIISLPLPRRRAKDGTSKTSQDLSAHPWAGARVTLTLIAKDEADQEGKSLTKTITLPERVFTKPLALAVVEERRNLALNADEASQVAEMLDIITDTHPDVFINDFSVYTALRVAYRTIKADRNDDQLREALDLLWETALAIEDGDLSRAERRLRDAQERLSKALENGASDKEIAELMKELRQAMNEFTQELAEQMAKNQQNQQAMPFDQNTQTLRQQDIDRMMKQIEDLAKSGSRDEARKLLQELQRMMNNLQTAQPNQQQQQQNDEFSKQMNKLGDMMRQQQDLMDQTFDMQRQQQQRNQQSQQQQQGKKSQPKDGQKGGQKSPQKPMTPEEFADAMKQLQKQQGELQKQMQELQDGLKGLGLDPGKKLGEAGEAMGTAEGKLGKGKSGQATGDQGRALQAMRDGAQQMMQQMQNQAGEQGRRGERGQHGQQSSQDSDPLGRQSRSRGPQLGQDTKVPGEIDVQRAREILEAIRRKLGETTRPKLELDYLDRLLPSR